MKFKLAIGVLLAVVAILLTVRVVMAETVPATKYELVYGTCDIAIYPVAGSNFCDFSIAWNSEESGRFAVKTAALQGMLVSLDMVPAGGGDAPTEYDTTISRMGIPDLLNGGGADCPAAATKSILAVEDSNGNIGYRMLLGQSTFSLTGAGNANKGQITGTLYRK